jgi:hypothetical protein
MNILNLKRQVAGYMLMCGGGGSSGSSNSGGDSGIGDSGRYSARTSYEEGGAAPSTTSTTEESGQPYQSNGGQPMYGADAPTETAYQSNGGNPMYGADTPAESAPTGISAGGDYSGYTTGTGYTNGDVSDAAPYAKDMTENEKNVLSIIKKVPILGQLASTVEGIGKFIQPGGSTMKRGEVGSAGGGNGGEDYVDEDGNPIAKKPIGLINSAAKPSPAVMDFINNPQQQSQQPQQSYTPPQAAVPANAGGGINASMYGSGSGWGASIAKFAKAKQGVQS